MKNLITDNDFEQFLYGGMPDLHPDIAHVVYASFRTNLIETNWSWAGTVGKKTDLRSTRHPELVTYETGKLGFALKSDVIATSDILQNITRTVAKYPFAKLTDNEKYRHKFNEPVKFDVTLEMNDLVIETTPPRDMLDIAVPLLREKDGVERYGAFMSVWNEIYGHIEPYVSSPGHRANLEILAADVATHSQPPFPRRIYCMHTSGQFR